VSLSHRIERSPAGQVALSALMVLLIVVLLVWNMPRGQAKDALVPAAGTVVQAVGLEQDWGLFAPDPRDASVGVLATVTFRDGRTERWAPPDFGRVLAPYRTYRWQKFVERLRADDYRRMWEPFARWVAREHGPGVRRVVLTRTFRPVRRPGDPARRPPTQRYDFYRLELG
jgi:hypothetical protein